MKAEIFQGVELPECWIVRDEGCNQFSIEAPGFRGGFVVVDFRARGFRGGLVRTGRLDSTGTYGGRGWRTKLVANAVRWLIEAIDWKGSRG